MACKSIADVLRGLGEVPPSDMALVDDGPPAPPCVPWVRREAIAAANAPDMVERTDDDRLLAWRRFMGSHFAAVARAAAKKRFTFGAQAKAKTPRPKALRTGEERQRHAACMKEYMREKRARQKAERAMPG